MKTDLKKILSVSGHPGLYRYLSQSKGGVIVESLTDGQRGWFGPSAKMTSLSDISIYTLTDEMRLQEVLEKIHEYLKDQDAPAAKSKPQELADFFAIVIPDYDKERFYPSHMKKVVEWYHVLKMADALDFEEDAAEDKPETDKPEAASQEPQA